MEKKIVYCAQSTHLDLFWMARMDRCLNMGDRIINDAVRDLVAHEEKTFLIETVRFLEYYLDRHPAMQEAVHALLASGRLEVGACYTDRLENHHDGESLVRNVVYGQRLLNEMFKKQSAIAAHPDLPGLAVQTPQIYHQTGVKYYTFARGYRDGARFRWRALNGESVVAYNYPIHYSHYDYNLLVERLGEIEKSIDSDAVLISLSSDDLGDYGTFQRSGFAREKNTDILAKLNGRDTRRFFQFSGVQKALEQMCEEQLPIYQGEAPSKWGTYGSATNVASFQQDKRLSARLLDAEKIYSLCTMHGIFCDDFKHEHPFCLGEAPHLLRDYYDAKIHPDTIQEWIDFAWRLQLITQDHNYGGIDGIATAFDRVVYKKIGLDIAEHVSAHCMEKLSEKVRGENGIIVLNPLNWERTGRTEAPAGNYAAMKDEDGNIYPIAHDGDGAYFESALPGLSYRLFMPVDKTNGAGDEKAGAAMEPEVIIQSDYYTAAYNQTRGGLVRLTDRDSGQELLGEKPLGIFSLYEDMSNDVHETKYEKRLIETTAGAQCKIEKGEDSLSIWMRWQGEIFHSQVMVTLRLYKNHKSFSIFPEVYWLGGHNTQLRLSFGLNPAFNDIYYASAYGMERFGQYMNGAEPTSPRTEISLELFGEYREVQGWFAAQSAEAGVSFSTNHSCFAFRPEGDFELILIRDVVSCGDPDVMMDNHGHHIMRFEGTSFAGEDVTKNDLWYKRGQELAHPFITAGHAQNWHGAMRSFATLLDAKGGILSALQRHAKGWMARSYSVRRSEEKLSFSLNGNPLKFQLCDMLMQPIQGDDILRYGDIKTVLVQSRHAFSYL